MAQSGFGNVGQNGKAMAMQKQKQHGGAGKTRDAQSSQGAKGDAKNAKARAARGVAIARRFTEHGKNPLDQVTYERRSSIITNPDGSIVFKLEGAEIPASWSQLATDIVISKYFRKAGIRGDKNVGERSVRDVVHRIAHTIRVAGDRFGGYFASKAEADAFEAELSFLLVNQYGAFNSPVWFNCGLFHEYGITGSGGNWAWDSSQPKASNVIETKNAYERPQCSACFIQSVQDDLMAMYDLIKSEARLFKYGSGTGSNFSNIRGKQEKLSGGGTSSGLMSFLEVFDRAAGATKSGGTTRRAAKMVCLDMDHPEIEDFINWKVREEKKALALIAAGFSSDFNGDAYHTVSGQNSNNSVRVTDDFMKAVQAGGKWKTTMRTSGETVATYDAKDLWHQLGKAAWGCADPGVQYDTTINRWHTCPNSGKINASNPCSEYMHLDDSACNLASLNLLSFLDADGTFDHAAFRSAVEIVFVAQEIIVGNADYPTEKIGTTTRRFRQLGLGYTNLGALLMALGHPYDSDAGRAWAAAITALMTGHAYATSARVSARMGPFAGFHENREPMLEVLEMHRAEVAHIDEERVPFVEIRDVYDNRVVTVIELLSPTNKRAGNERQKYLTKRAEVLASSASLMKRTLVTRPSPTAARRLSSCSTSATASTPWWPAPRRSSSTGSCRRWPIAASSSPSGPSSTRTTASTSTRCSSLGSSRCSPRWRSIRATRSRTSPACRSTSGSWCATPRPGSSGLRASRCPPACPACSPPGTAWCRWSSSSARTRGACSRAWRSLIRCCSA